MNHTLTLTDEQLIELESALKLSVCYLNKMKQWKQGKIELAVEGCDPPRVLGDDEIMNEMVSIVNWQVTLAELV